MVSSKTSKKTDKSKHSEAEVDKKQVKLSDKDAEHLHKNLKAVNGESDKPKKDNRYTHVEKGSAPNKETAWAQLFFNVKNVRKYIKKYLENTHNLKDVPMKDFQFSATVVIELFMKVLAENAFKYAKKDNKQANLYVISLENVKRAVKDNLELNQYLGYVTDTFNTKDLDYVNSFATIAPDTHIKNFIETKLEADQLSFEPDALNLLLRLTLYNVNKHIDLANSHREYAQKKSLDFKSLVTANKFLLSGEYQKKCAKKFDSIEAQLPKKHKKSDDNDANDEVDEEEAEVDEDEDDEDEVKSSKKKKSSKESSDDEDDEDEVKSSKTKKSSKESSKKKKSTKESSDDEVSDD